MQIKSDQFGYYLCAFLWPK